MRARPLGTLLWVALWSLSPPARAADPAVIDMTVVDRPVTLLHVGNLFIGGPCAREGSSQPCQARAALARVSMTWLTPHLLAGGRRAGVTMCNLSRGSVRVGRLPRGELAVCVFSDGSVTTLQSLESGADTNDLARKRGSH
jgi:hypothetical protein